MVLQGFFNAKNKEKLFYVLHVNEHWCDLKFNF